MLDLTTFASAFIFGAAHLWSFDRRKEAIGYFILGFFFAALALIGAPQ